jgi:hypothetical protein
MTTWVLVYIGIAVAGLVMVGCFAVWLWRLAMALLRELGVLLERVDELAGLLEQIGQPAGPEPVRDARLPQDLHSMMDDDEPEMNAVELRSGSRPAT